MVVVLPVTSTAFGIWVETLCEKQNMRTGGQDSGREGRTKLVGTIAVYSEPTLRGSTGSSEDQRYLFAQFQMQLCHSQEESHSDELLVAAIEVMVMVNADHDAPRRVGVFGKSRDATRIRAG